MILFFMIFIIRDFVEILQIVLEDLEETWRKTLLLRFLGFLIKSSDIYIDALQCKLSLY